MIPTGALAGANFIIYHRIPPMDIDSITFGEIKAIQAMTAGIAPTATRPTYPIGSYVIVRCSAAGVHAGTLTSVDGDVVNLTNSRRLWRWFAADGIALSGLAVHGLDTSKANNIDSVLPSVVLRGWCEIIPAECARASIAGFKS